MKNNMNYVKNLRVAEEIHFIFDGEDIQIFDLVTQKEVRLTYKGTIEFFRDIPFKNTLDIHENSVSPKIGLSVKAVYVTDYHEMELHVLSDDDRYLVKLCIGCYNVKVSLDEFKESTFLNSEIVM